MLTNDQINHIAQAAAVAVAHTLSSMNVGQPAPVQQPKAAPIKVAKPKASSTVVKPANKPTDKLTKRHAAIVAGFKRLGIKDPQLFTDIKSYQAWLQAGRIVQKGQHGVSGLFHRDQTKPLTGLCT